jgi:transcriptional regulator with XRE-family HTH domain
MYENLKKLRLSLGMNQETFGAVFGKKKTTYAGYEQGVSDPGSDFWIAVADKYNVSIDWLMGFTDDPQRSKFATPSTLDRKYAALDAHGRRVVDLVMDAEAERVQEASAAQVVDLGTIRHYLYSPAAGPDGFVSGSDYEDIPRTADMPDGADFCLTVSGDSMEPYIHDGEMIYISETAPVGEMEVGVWFFQGGTYVKQYAPSYDGSVYLLSANPAREAANVRVPPEAVSSLVCFGKVLGIKKLPPPIYR